MEQDILNRFRAKDAQFPYETKFSLHRVIDNWQQKAKSPDVFVAKKAKMILSLIDDYPDIHKPFKTASDLGDALHFIHHLFSDVYATDFADEEALSITAPFIFESLFQTEKFKHIVLNIDQDDNHFLEYLEEGILLSRLIQAYTFIFHRVYGMDLLEADVPLVIPHKSPKTGLVRYYTEEVYTQFIEVEADNFPNLTQDQIEELVANYGNYDLWLKYLPPDQIYFSGVALLKFIDITERESLTRLQTVLLEDSLMTQDALKRIEKVMGNFLEMKDLSIGLVAYGEYLTLYKVDEELWSSVLIHSGVDFSHRKLKKLFEEKFKSTQDILLIQPEQDDFFPEKIRSKIIETGTKGLMLAPLFKDGELIGVLEVSSRIEKKMSFAINKLTKAIPLFELAVERSVETVYNRVQAIIKENCTAIHPSVEWKFLKRAVRAYQKASTKDSMIPQMGRISFKKVYPLYGLFDIRNSSTLLNKAIASDLHKQINLAVATIHGLKEESRLRILDQLEYHLQDHFKEGEIDTSPQDDDDIYTFLEQEVTPVFRQLEKDPRVNQKWVLHYLDQLDPELGIIYDQRKAFEESISKINNAIGNLLDREQVSAQEIYPHYFEKFKTDGIDYNIFIGESISPGYPFSKVYLRNIRLWQLENMVNISLYLRHMKGSLEMELETAQMIFVQNIPIDILFKSDEKRFDVDGSFHARFEVVKKRLDKATTREMNERLTQPGHIAIVYSHSAVLGEYMDYIEYLQHKGLLKENIEFLELNEMQGLEGMKAIRVQLSDEKNGLITELENHHANDT